MPYALMLLVTSKLEASVVGKPCWIEGQRVCCRYLCYLFFQLKTHADELAEGGGEETPALSLFGALGLLTAITLVVATNSE